jgi:hypothetical protein
MSTMKSALVGAAIAMIAAGTANAATTRAQGSVPVNSVTAKKLTRSSAPVSNKSKDAAAPLLALLAGGGAVFGAIKLFEDDSAGS